MDDECTENGGDLVTATAAFRAEGKACVALRVELTLRPPGERRLDDQSKASLLQFYWETVLGRLAHSPSRVVGRRTAAGRFDFVFEADADFEAELAVILENEFLDLNVLRDNFDCEIAFTRLANADPASADPASVTSAQIEPRDPAIERALQRARARLREGTGDLFVLAREDAATPVAFLVTLDREQGALIVPLREGRNFVGRRMGDTRPFGTWPRPYAVEQCTWFIECGRGTATVRDAASTNGSTRERGAESIVIPHPSLPAEAHVLDLREADVLRGCYAAFVFGWIGAGRAAPSVV